MEAGKRDTPCALTAKYKPPCATPTATQSSCIRSNSEKRLYGVALTAASAWRTPSPTASSPQQISTTCPELGSITLLQPADIGSAVLSRMLSACAWVRSGSFSAIKATVPATWEEAMDVPLRKK